MKIMNNNKNILGFLLAFVLLFVGCTSILPNLEGKVITTSEYIIPGNDSEVAPVPPDALPEKLREAWQGKTIVLAPKEAVQSDAPQVPLYPKSAVDTAVGDMVAIGFDILSAFFPWLAAYSGVIALLFRRPRQHFADAIKAALPLDGNIDLKGSVMSLAKGLGMLHTQPVPVMKEDTADKVVDATRIDETKPAT